MDVFVTTAVAVALALGYLLGRLRPWDRLGNWAADQVRFTGSWLRGGTGRQAVVVLAHAVTAPRTSWRIMRPGVHRDADAHARTRSGLGRQPFLGRARVDGRPPTPLLAWDSLEDLDRARPGPSIRAFVVLRNLSSRSLLSGSRLPALRGEGAVPARKRRKHLSPATVPPAMSNSRRRQYR